MGKALKKCFHVIVDACVKFAVLETIAKNLSFLGK